MGASSSGSISNRPDVSGLSASPYPLHRFMQKIALGIAKNAIVLVTQGRTRVWLQERGAPAAEGAVHVELHGSHGQPPAVVDRDGRDLRAKVSAKVARDVAIVAQRVLAPINRSERPRESGPWKNISVRLTGCAGKRCELHVRLVTGDGSGVHARIVHAHQAQPTETPHTGQNSSRGS